MSNELFEHRGLARQVTVAPWVLAHEAVLEVAKERALLERREGTSLLRAHRERVHRHLGYGAFAEYTDRHLGYCHRTTVDKLRTAEALEQLPELARAQQEGRLHRARLRPTGRRVREGLRLCWLGFKTSEARRALDECTRDCDAPLDTAALLRKALERLG